MKNISNTQEYVSPEINVLDIELESAICAMSTELLDYDDDVIDL